jgi:hypothetical protein
MEQCDSLVSYGVALDGIDSEFDRGSIQWHEHGLLGPFTGFFSLKSCIDSELVLIGWNHRLRDRVHHRPTFVVDHNVA